MTITRRRALGALSMAAAAVTLPVLPAFSASRETIDARVNLALEKLYKQVAGSRELAQKAKGILIMPDVVKGGFIVGGAYGEGALIVGGATVDYVSMAAASLGLQIGAQTFSQALFFMTPEALADFRQSDGWELGVDAEVALIDSGAGFGASTTTISRPVYQVLYGQRGLIVGASLEGAKYNRLIR